MASGPVCRTEQAEHMAAPTKAASVKKALANSEPMVWTPPSRRGGLSNVNCDEGEVSCRSFG